MLQLYGCIKAAMEILNVSIKNKKFWVQSNHRGGLWWIVVDPHHCRPPMRQRLTRQPSGAAARMRPDKIVYTLTVVRTTMFFGHKCGIMCTAAINTKQRGTLILTIYIHEHGEKVRKRVADNCDQFDGLEAGKTANAQLNMQI